MGTLYTICTHLNRLQLTDPKEHDEALKDLQHLSMSVTGLRLIPIRKQMRRVGDDPQSEQVQRKEDTIRRRYLRLES